MKKKCCVDRESIPDLLLGRQQCQPLHHQRHVGNDLLSKKILSVAVRKYANKVRIKNLFLPGVRFEPTPTIVDQNAYEILKSGAFDRSANLTRLDTNLTPTFK